MARFAILLNFFPLIALASMDVSLVANYIRERRCEAFLDQTSRPLLMVVGLGNVGYEGTRHNAGFEVVEHLMQSAGAVRLGANDHWLTFTANSEEEAASYVEFSGASSPKREGVNVHYRVGGEVAIVHSEPSLRPVLFVKPRYDINESGHFVAALMGELGLKPENILVVVDDIQLARNQIALSQGKVDGSKDAHNGLRSINAAIGRGDYWRLRIGVSSPRQEKVDGTLVDWVLGPIPENDRESLLSDDAIWLFRSLIVSFSRRINSDQPPQQLIDEGKRLVETLNGLLRP